MTETPPLPWVKWPTKLAGDPRWRVIPMDMRGVYQHLVLLGATSPTRWVLPYSDQDIAGLIGCRPYLVTKTVERFVAAGSLRRTREGIEVVHTETYGPPANYDPAAAYGRVAGDRVSTESSPKAPAESGPKIRERKSREKRKSSPPPSSITLATLQNATEWWNALAAQYPTVDLAAELARAQDWYGADKVRSPKLYFRNWIERAARDAKAPEQPYQPEGDVRQQLAALEERMAVPA